MVKGVNEYNESIFSLVKKKYEFIRNQRNAKAEHSNLKLNTNWFHYDSPEKELRQENVEELEETE